MKRKPKPYIGRDNLIVEIIKGVTKAAIHKDKKKEENKKMARKKVTEKE